MDNLTPTDINFIQGLILIVAFTAFIYVMVSSVRAIMRHEAERKNRH